MKCPAFLDSEMKASSIGGMTLSRQMVPFEMLLCVDAEGWQGRVCCIGNVDRQLMFDGMTEIGVFSPGP